MAKVLITGAAGRLGSLLRGRLPGHELRLTDLVPGDGVAGLDVTDPAAVERACAGVDAVVHLAGIRTEAGFDELLAANVRGSQRVLEAARKQGVSTVVLASSNHAVGLEPRRDGLPDEVAGRPDTYYGWSKVAVEALAGLYHDRHGLNVVCLRIGYCAERPTNARHLAVWLSPDDLARLVEASLSATGRHTVWGVSANTRRWWSTAGGDAIGYRPRDDAERWAAEIGTTSPAEADEVVGGVIPGWVSP